MSEFPAEVFPERIELEAMGLQSPATTAGTLASFSDRGLALAVADPTVVDTFAAGTKVRASYGDHSGFCQFDSAVLEVSTGGPADGTATILLEPPAQVTTTQRRRSIRADVDLTIPCALLDGPDMTFVSAPGEVANLGGGGLMMIIAAHPSLVVGSRLALALPVPGGDPVLALGRAVQVDVEPEGPATVRLAFSSLDGSDRDRIERFVFRRLGGSAPAKLWSSGKITTSQPSRSAKP